MPFLEGIPCSIHGVVFPDGVATFRPVEMVTLRRPGSNRLHYAGAATFWDPPAAGSGCGGRRKVELPAVVEGHRKGPAILVQALGPEE